MEVSAVSSKPERGGLAPDPRVWLAFGAIYFLWGATFLAVRVTVLAIPPFFAAGLRFFIAGSLLYGLMRARGVAAPAPRQWRAIAVIAVCMFVLTYGALFWAEQYVPSGVTAVIDAPLPIIAMVFEVFVFRRQPFHWRMLGAVALGFGGIVLLLWHDGPQTLAVLPCVAILGSAVVWTLGAVLTRSMALPASVPLAAGAEMMVGGAILLVLAFLTGELRPLPHIPPRAVVALAYLITGGSLVAFTSYQWLLVRMPATRVASHAYVNPVVAVALGALVGGEEVTPRMLFASASVVASVFLILKLPRTTEARDDRL